MQAWWGAGMVGCRRGGVQAWGGAGVGGVPAWWDFEDGVFASRVGALHVTASTMVPTLLFAAKQVEALNTPTDGRGTMGRNVQSSPTQ